MYCAGFCSVILLRWRGQDYETSKAYSLLFHPDFSAAVFLFGSFFAPNDPTATNIRDKFLSSSTEYPFGTDNFGRCEFSRILEGGKTTLGIVLTGSAIVIILGVFFGILLAKTGRRRNILAESILNAVTAIPPVAYLIIFIGIWGNSIPTMLVALTASLILRMIKLVKTLIEVEYGKAYIMCAIACGAGKARIMLVHIFAEHYSGHCAVYLPFLCGNDYCNLWLLVHWPVFGG